MLWLRSVWDGETELSGSSAFIIAIERVNGNVDIFFPERSIADIYGTDILRTGDTPIPMTPFTQFRFHFSVLAPEERVSEVLRTRGHWGIRFI
jgi:hypothetical protein